MFTTAVIPFVGPDSQPDTSYLVQKFSVCPAVIKGIKVTEDVKSLVSEWADTMQDEIRKSPGMEKVVILPNWGRDIPSMQQVYMMCGEDKEATRQLATMFWTGEKYKKLDPTVGLFAHCAEQLLLGIARQKREGLD